ncbi:MAG: tetratricopeptide repeat protein, partial [Planctomycetota bacterium]
LAAKRYDPPDRIAAMVIAGVGGNADSAPAELALLVARSMQANERPRARLRWLIRAFSAAEPTDALCLELARAFLENGRQGPALAALDLPMQRGTGDVEILDLRMQVARWTGRLEAEIVAIDRLLEIEESNDLLDRMIEVQTACDRPAEAVPYAVRLAERTGNLLVMERAADLAFQGGDVETGFTLQRRLVAEAADPRPWREKLARRLLLDVRVDEAIEVYETLAGNHPDGGYDERLEELLRRRNRNTELVVVLRRRYAKEPTEALESELIRLSAAVGDMEETRDLVKERLEGLDDPDVFFRNLLQYHAAGVGGLDTHALRLIGAGGLDEETLEVATFAIWELREEDGIAEVARAMGLAYPENERAREARISSFDWGNTPAGAAEAAERHLAEHPGDELVHRAWIDRAGWAGLGGMEIRARSAWADTHPDDHDNRRRLADLLDQLDRHDEAADQWALLIAVDGEGSESERRHLDSLRAAGNHAEEFEYLLKRAEREDLTVEERLHLAERFFAGQWLDVALASYATVLEEVPDERTALLRIGQIRLWGNDPEGAIPYLERLVELDGPGDGEVPFYLGEAYAAADRRAEAWEMREIALPLLRTEGELTVEREGMVAKILAQTGRLEEAIAIYERLTTQVPDDQSLLLDYAVTMIATERTGDARRVIDRAKAIAPDSRRVLRMDGQVLVMEGRRDEAIVSFRKGIEKYGSDAGTWADLGQACLDAGRWRESREAFARVLVLQPENRYAALTHRVLTDRIEGTLEVGGRTKVVAEDESLDSWLAGSFEAFDEFTRLSFQGSFGRTSGRSAAVDDGKTDVTASITSLGVSLFRRFGQDWEGGGGLDLYAGRDGASPVGGWLGAGWEAKRPDVSVTARFSLHEPLTDPAAAAGLGGDQTGLRLDGYWQNPDGDFWLSGTAWYRSLSVDSPETGAITNGQAIASLSAGTWLHDRGPRVLSRLTPRAGPVLDEGTTVAGEIPEDEGIRLSTWITYTGIRLLSDKELANVLPMGEAFDYLTISGRAEGRVLSGIYYEAEGYAGTDLTDPEPFVGLLAGVSWRPSPGFEFRIRGGHGLAFGRENGDSGSTEVRLAVTVHW